MMRVPLPRVLMSVGRRYVQHINHTYARTGTLWDGRYKSSLVQADTYLVFCQRSIELNPVRGGMVSDPGEYRWSSYRNNALGQPDALVTPHPLYLALALDGEAHRATYNTLAFRGELLQWEYRLMKRVVTKCESTACPLRAREDATACLQRNSQPASG